MREAIKVLTEAKRQAEARLRRYEGEGKASAHKIPRTRHAIRELEIALEWLTWASGQRDKMINLQLKLEEGKYSVQALSSNKKRRRQGS